MLFRSFYFITSFLALPDLPQFILHLFDLDIANFVPGLIVMGQMLEHLIVSVGLHYQLLQVNFDSLKPHFSVIFNLLCQLLVKTLTLGSLLLFQCSFEASYLWPFPDVFSLPCVAFSVVKSHPPKTHHHCFIPSYNIFPLSPCLFLALLKP